VLKNEQQLSTTHHGSVRKALDTLDSAIAMIAAPQHGVVTHYQLLALGLTERMIWYRIKIGRLHPLHRGVYAVGHVPVSPHAHAIAAVLACGPGALLSHSSAATLWGVTKEWSSPLEVTASSARRRSRLRIHRSKTLTAGDRAVHFGIPATSPARTLLDNANSLTDGEIARAISDLRHARYLSLADLDELLTRHPPCRAANRLRKHTKNAPHTPTRSPFEDDFLPFLERYGLPKPEINTHIAGHEVDVLFRAHKLVVELDGWEFHSGRTAFESDRDRDADLLAAGIATVRVTRERFDLTPDREAARLHTILAHRAPKPPPPPKPPPARTPAEERTTRRRSRPR